jgi:Putative metal-binding motif/FG-GAP-like repeat/FG-GAP repeat
MKPLLLNRSFITLFALLAACADKGNTDQDGDGFVGDDCDETDPLVFPGAVEACNEIDDNCDGQVDEGVTTDWSQDADGDGYGEVGGTTTAACEPPPGTAASSDDCDDSDTDIHPAAPERCNSLDDNCDGVADDGVGQNWYVDQDGDGFGLAGTGELSCEEQRPGWALNDSDCDDTDATAFPGAAEVCGDSDDDDCDGLPDAGAEGLFYSDLDLDGYGDPDDSELTCEPQAGWLADSSDCAPADPNIHPGATETCNATDDDCNGVVDDGVDADGDGFVSDLCVGGDDCDDSDSDIWPGLPDEVCEDGIDQDCSGADRHCGFDGTVLLSAMDAHVYNSEATGYASMLTQIGDVTGDGIGDLLVSTYTANNSGGGGYLVPGPISGTDTYDNLGHALSGTYDETWGAGKSIGIGDVDGDGIGDVGFGAPYADNNGVYVAYGPISGDRDLSAPDAYVGGPIDTFAGHGTALGDFTGDGIADLAMGAPYSDSSGVFSGAAYLVSGPITGTLSAPVDGTILAGAEELAYAGRSVVIDGDVNGDGINDVLIAAPYTDSSLPDRGSVYLIHGPGTGLSELEDADAIMTGPAAYALIGEGDTMAAKDMDADGYADLAIGSRTDAMSLTAGAVYLNFGPISGAVDLRVADVIIEGLYKNMDAGSAVSQGDVDGDGIAELLIGARGDSTATTSGGGAYLFLAPLAGTYAVSDAEAWFIGDSGTSGAGNSAVLGDLNDDGLADVAIGAPYDATSGSSTSGGTFIHRARN